MELLIVGCPERFLSNVLTVAKPEDRFEGVQHSYRLSEVSEVSLTSRPNGDKAAGIGNTPRV